jgi:hypothetical protein
MWLKFDAKGTQVCFSNLIKCENLEMHGGHETARWLPHLWHWFLQPVALRTLFWLLTHAAQFALATWLWLERAPQRTFCNSPSAWSAHPWGSLWRPNHWAWEAGFFLSGCDLLPTSISASNTRIYICVYIYIYVHNKWRKSCMNIFVRNESISIYIYTHYICIQIIHVCTETTVFITRFFVRHLWGLRSSEIRINSLWCHPRLSITAWTDRSKFVIC